MAKTMKPEATPVADAEQTLVELEQKRAKLVEARTKEDAQMANISSQAHARGDHEANDVFTAIIDRAMRHDAEIRSIDAAIARAKEVLAGARQAEAAATSRKSAVELKKHADALRAYAQTCDDALNVLLGAGDQMGAQLNEIHRLGCANPSHSQLFSLGQRAITTVLMRSPWSRAFSPITPAEKTRFVDFVGTWERMLANEIARRQGESK